MFKLNNKDTRTTPVSIANFEHVITGWERKFEKGLVKLSELVHGNKKGEKSLPGGWRWITD